MIAVEAEAGEHDQNECVKKVDEDKDETDETKDAISQIKPTRWTEYLLEVGDMLDRE